MRAIIRLTTTKKYMHVIITIHTITAFGSVASETILAFTTEAAGSVGAYRIGVAIVSTKRALVLIRTFRAITIISWLAFATEAAGSVGA